MTTPPSKKSVHDDSEPPQDQPQRSRNARAQARHRAKRKAYIEQLEETVTKLQAALNLSPEQVAALPTAQVRIRELEHDNMRLRSENNTFRMQLEHFSRGHDQSGRRDMMDDPVGDREKKRRRLSGETEGVYLTPGGTPSHSTNNLTRPPPLSIPHSGHQQSYLPPLGSNGLPGLGSSNSLFSIHQPGFQGPGTPTASSSASTPSYSASSNPLPPVDPPRGKYLRASSSDPSDIVRSLPLQHQHNNHSSLNHPSSSSNPNSHMHLPPPISTHFHHSNVPSYSQQGSHYEVVPKSEDDYPLTSQDSPANNNFPPNMHSFGSSEHDSSNWHVYSAERAQVNHQ